MALQTWILPIGGGGSVALNEHPLARHAALGDPMLWVDAAEALAREAEGLLSQDELHALDQMVAAKRRAEWLMGRLAAKAAMAQACALAPRLMAVDAPEGGGPPKPGGPYWPELMGEAWGLSLAHSAGRALAVVAPGPVGCDLEAGDPPPASGWRFFLRPEELEALPEDQVPEGMALKWWTAKEAAYKALGGVPGGLRAMRLRDPMRPEAGILGPAGEGVGVALGRAHFGAWAIARPEGAAPLGAEGPP